MIIRKATRADAAALAELAERTFRDAFAAQNRAEDIETYVARVYGEAQQRAEIEDPAVITLVIEDGGALTGFAQLRRESETRIEIARFYVDRAFHGRGLAQSLMDAALSAARNAGAATIWLGVWEHNARAIRFYEKCGFADTGSHPFLLGNDVQTDRVMEREVG